MALEPPGGRDQILKPPVGAGSRYDYLINVVRLKSGGGVLTPPDLAVINGFLTSPTTLPVVRPKG